MQKRMLSILLAGMFLVSSCLGCGSGTAEPDDYVTNEGYEVEAGEEESNTSSEVEASNKIALENVKIAVLYISDPNEGSGYSYTHDLGIIGMQSNLGLSDDQIVRKIVDDSDAEATQAAIEECISDGCNIIFATSWGYMETTAQMAEKYPDVYFSHGTGYMSNGKK